MVFAIAAGVAIALVATIAFCAVTVTIGLVAPGKFAGIDVRMYEMLVTVQICTVGLFFAFMTAVTTA